MSQVLFDIGAIGGGSLITAVNGGFNINVTTVAGVATVSVAGTTNHAVQVGNMFGALTSLALGNAGQVLTSNGPGLDPTWQNVPGAVGILGVNTNAGVALPVAGFVNLVTANSTVLFTAVGNTITQDFNKTNLVLGSSLPALAGGLNNVGLGENVLQSVTSGSDNTAIGDNAGIFLTTSNFNTLIGSTSGGSLTTGSTNTAIGFSSLGNLTTGFNNISVGYLSSSAYTTNEFNNIAIGNGGVVLDAGTIRIGTGGIHNRCFVSGIYLTTPLNPTTQFVVVDSNGQLGSQAQTFNASGSGQTIGAVTLDLITLPLGATPQTLSAEARVAAFDAITPLGAVYKLFSGVRTTGAAAVSLGAVDQIVNEEGALVAGDATFVIAGNNYILRVTGTAGKTVNWVGNVTFTVSS